MFAILFVFDFYKFADSNRSSQDEVNISLGRDYGVALGVALGLAVMLGRGLDTGDAAPAGDIPAAGDALPDGDGEELPGSVGIAAPSTCTRSRTA
jgi:hypothetical protein